MRTPLTYLALLTLLAACVPQQQPAPSPNPLAGATWIASELGEQPVLAQQPPTLDVQPDGSVSGKSGCNGFAGAMVVADETLTFGNLISTKIACPPPQSAQEQRYFQALEATRRYLLDGNSLRLLDDSGATLVRYER